MKLLPVSSRILSPDRVFNRLRYRLIKNSLNSLFKKDPLRAVLVFGLSLVLWGGLYFLFAESFRFLNDTAKYLVKGVAEKLFDLFFLALGSLMVFSTGVLLFGSLFRSPDTTYLLTTPARADYIFSYKFHEALFFGGWALVLLGMPLMLAYGIEMASPWYYFVVLLPYLFGYLLLTGSVGAALCLWIVYIVPAWRRHALAITIVGLLSALGLWAAYLFSRAGTDVLEEAWLGKMIKGLGVGDWPFLPSKWMTVGLIDSSLGTWDNWLWDERAGQLRAYLFHGLLLWSNALLAWFFATWSAYLVFRPGYHRLAGAGSAKRKVQGSLLDPLVNLSLGWLNNRMRLFVAKDIKTFVRDPVQWAQVLIISGILFLYFVNLKQLPHSQYLSTHRSLIALINLTVVGLLMATYTSRFIFPLMSLEGRNFWILSLLPITRDQLVWGKFAYASTVTMGTCFSLGLLSEFMLALDPIIIVYHIMALATLGLGLSALSVGMGSYLIDLKETNPSKIATGYGGTINLLLSLLLTMLTTSIASVPTLFGFLGNVNLDDPSWPYDLKIGMLLGTVTLAVSGMVFIFVPLTLGIGRFRRMEF